MATSRTTLRAMRTLRTRPATQPIAFRVRPTGRRGYADAPGGASAQNPTNAGLVGGIAGGSLVFLLAYGYYYTSGAKTAVNSLSSTKKYFDTSVKKLQDAAPEPNEALQWLRDTTLAYSAAIPGAKSYVNMAFDDLDAIHDKHGEEVDKIITEMYNEVKETTKKGGLSVETAYKVWDILGQKLSKITSLAGDAAEQIMDNHPYLKSQVGGNISHLKQLGEQLGPEAQEQVNKTWEQVQSILNEGFSASTIAEIRSLVQEKSEMLKKLGDQAWSKGLEQAKPYLDKVPQARELLEKNADALKSGNMMELWEKVKQAASSGSTKDLEQYVKQAGDKAKKGGQSMMGGSIMGFDVSKIMDMVPGGGEMAEKWEQLQKIGSEHGKEAQDILESTVKEVKEVLAKKVEDAQKLADKAKKSAS